MSCSPNGAGLQLQVFVAPLQRFCRDPLAYQNPVAPSEESIHFGLGVGPAGHQVDEQQKHSPMEGYGKYSLVFGQDKK